MYKTSGAQGGLPPVVIKNSETGEVVARVHVSDRNSGQLKVSDEKGTVLFDRITVPVKLHFSHVSYVDTTIIFRSEDITGKGILIVHLRPLMVFLPEVDVTRPGPEVVYQRKDLHVGAYHVNADGVWVLVYDRPQLWHRQENAGQQILRGARLYLLDTLFRERAVHRFSTDVRGMHRDHLQRPIVEGERIAWIAEARNDAIALGMVDRDTLHGAILPWTDTLGGKLLGNDLDRTFPEFDHLAYDPVSDRIIPFCTVTDRHVLQLFRSEYKYMSGRDKVIAMDLELETGIDREIIAGYMTGFYNNIYFSVPYAPSFVVNDTIFIFDHTTERIRRFDRDLSSLDEIPMTHHNDRSWKRVVLQDPATKRIYSLHTKGSRTSVREIDLSTGEMGRSFTLTHPFPEEVKIHDGHVWYVYRPYGSTQRRTLYREHLDL